ncbi:MFS transporter [Streptomyces iconiensis]|uniref:MFS transporter n=1 Tax=Streptomyces iconiensis TaxID=1384038 RepID=A0ABT6ZUI9_9ACTN|nr:MFS transporter [Streptomyces iconiensis]MDJ1132730.1 MFS transporter [Streptomyces iconiensis]
MFCLVFGLVKAPDWHWGDPRTIGFLVGALVLGAAFVLRQSRAAHPLLPLTLFRSVSLSAAAGLTVLMAFPMYGAMFFITFYFQGVHGLSPVRTGVQLLPMTAMIIIGSPMAGALASRFGPRPLAVGGMGVAAVAMLGMATMGKEAAGLETAVWFLLLGIGLSPVVPCVTQAILSNAPLRLSGTASGLQQAAMQVGGSLSTAVLSAVMTSRVGGTLGGHLRDAGVPADHTRVEQAKGMVAQGVAPVPPHTPEPLAQRITTAAHHSFMDGLHTSFLVAGTVTALGALLAVLVRADPAKGGAPPAP